MRYPTAIQVMAVLSATTVATQAHGATFVYVSKVAEQQIQVYRLNPDDGSLTPTTTVDVEGTPGSMSVDRERQFLFASLRSKGLLAAFRFEPSSGDLLSVSRAELSPAANATYLKADATGKWLISASYTGGTVVVHPLLDGLIGPNPVQTIETSKTAHFVSFDRENRWVFVPHVAPNAVFQFKFDAISGQLTDAGELAPGGGAGAGPRHLAWHPTANLAFTSNETGSSITSYQFDPDSGLTPRQTLSTLPPNFAEKNTTAEVKVHPTGRFVWVSNRGHDSLAGFTINSAGMLAPIEQTPTEATPRSFDVDPSGKFIFSAGEGSGNLVVFAVDQQSGRLNRLSTYNVGKSLSWVMAVELDRP